MTTTYCDKCGAYIPSTSDVCLSCGKPKRFYSEAESDYLFFNGEKIPVFIVDWSARMVDIEPSGRTMDGTLVRTEFKFVREFRVIEKIN